MINFFDFTDTFLVWEDSQSIVTNNQGYESERYTLDCSDYNLIIFCATGDLLKFESVKVT